MGSDLIGRSLGHFRIVEKIGEGGMGVVYVAMDERLRRTVALKVLRPEVADDERRRGRFLREARFAASLAHPNVCAVHEVGESDGLVYMAMELLEGSSLRKRLARGRLPAAQALTIARDVARALARAHEKGIIHRDLKPDNVIVYEPNPGVLAAKVLDFGLAKALEVDRGKERGSIEHENTATFVTAHGVAIGTPGYMAPEQAKGLEVDARADVYSFGVMLYEMLTGRSPFKGKTTEELIAAAGRDDMPPPSEIVRGLPSAIDALYARCVDRTINRRFADGTALVVALHPLLDAGAHALLRSVTTSLSFDDATDREPATPGRPAPATVSLPPAHATESYTDPNGTPAITDLTLVPIDDPPKRRSAPPLPSTVSTTPKTARGIRPVHLAGLVALGTILAFFVGRMAVVGPTQTSAMMATPTAPIPATGAIPTLPLTTTTTATTAIATAVATSTATATAIATATADEVAGDLSPAQTRVTKPTKPAHRTTSSPKTTIANANANANANATPMSTAAAVSPPPAATPTPTPAPTADDCATPFYFNAEGIKVPKRHCLR